MSLLIGYQFNILFYFLLTTVQTYSQNYRRH